MGLGGVRVAVLRANEAGAADRPGATAAKSPTPTASAEAFAPGEAGFRRRYLRAAADADASDGEATAPGVDQQPAVVDTRDRPRWPVFGPVNAATVEEPNLLLAAGGVGTGLGVAAADQPVDLDRLPRPGVAFESSWGT
jgi:hypothetical protein